VAFVSSKEEADVTTEDSTAALGEDAEKEFTAEEFEALCTDKGIDQAALNAHLTKSS